MNIFSIVAFGIVASIVIIILKEYKPEYTVMISLAASAVILLFIITSISPVFDMFNNLSSLTGLDTQYGKILLKSLGICVVAQIGSDVCKDCGQTSVSSKIELSGKVAVLVISLPLFSSVLKIIEKIIFM